VFYVYIHTYMCKTTHTHTYILFGEANLENRKEVDNAWKRGSLMGITV